MSKVTSASEIAKNLDLVEIDTEIAINEIKLDILRTFYTENPANDFEKERNEKVKKAYLEWTGSDYEHDNMKILSILLLGSPGQGKTTAFKEAAKQVAAGLNLTYVENPSDDFKITRDCFMFVSQEFSAENSKVDLGGIPSKVEEDGIEYMTKLVNKRLAKAKSAGGSLLLLDDFPNASANIQNIGLSVTDEKRFQGLNLDGVYIGLTGNLGAVDGTHTAQLSTALRGRCKNILYTR